MLHSKLLVIQKLLTTKAHVTLRAPYSDRFVPYLYGVRNEMAIIDLDKTLVSLRRACHLIDLLVGTSDTGIAKHFLFVNTTSEYNIIVQSTASLAKQSYINHKWVGGLLTNWSHMQNVQHHFEMFSVNAQQSNRISQKVDVTARSGRQKRSLKRVQVLSLRDRASSNASHQSAKDKARNTGVFGLQSSSDTANFFTSFPRFKKMQKCFEGLTAKPLPDCIIVLNATQNAIAINEANQLRIPIIALVDSKTPHELHEIITYPIPANPNSFQFIYLFCNCILKTILFSKKKWPISS